jgi:hypothetical protein
MHDTSSAANHRHAERPPWRAGGIEPVDGTWFETGDEPPADRPLILLVPVRRTTITGPSGRTGSG